MFLGIVGGYVTSIRHQIAMIFYLSLVTDKKNIMHQYLNKDEKELNKIDLKYFGILSTISKMHSNHNNVISI